MASESEIQGVQKTYNGFTDKWLRGYPRLRVDGIMGKATKSRTMAIKHFLGWGKNRTTKVDKAFLHLVRNPRQLSAYPGNRRQRAQMLATGIARRAHQKAPTVPVLTGVGKIDGVRVAAWLIPKVKEARRRGWDGVVISGFRSPAYSEGLCIQICGRPVCPGRCAGRDSGHSQYRKPKGCIDVTDHVEFGEIQAELGDPKLINRIGPSDPNHFSVSGR